MSLDEPMLARGPGPDETIREPPEGHALLWCPVCGRTDRVVALSREKHYAHGARCPGTPTEIRYVQESRLSRVERERDQLREALAEKLTSAALTISLVRSDDDDYIDLGLLPYYEGKRDGLKTALDVLAAVSPAGQDNNGDET